MVPPPKKGKVKSGNPAKRAEQEREAAARAAGLLPKGPAGSAFGLGRPADESEPAALELPPGLEKFLGR